MEKIIIADTDVKNDDNKEHSDKKSNEKICQIDDNKPWNYKILLLLRKIGKKTMGYRWMHEQEANYYNDLETKFETGKIIIIILLSLVNGTSLYNTFAGTYLEYNLIFHATISIINLVGLAALAFSIKYPDAKKYTDLKHNHFNASLRNAELNLTIQSQLALNLEDRESDKMFLQSIIRLFKDILYLSPSIRETTKKKYIAESEENEIFNPLFGTGDDLQIIIQNDLSNGNDSGMKYQIDRWLQHF